MRETREIKRRLRNMERQVAHITRWINEFEELNRRKKDED